MASCAPVEAPMVSSKYKRKQVGSILRNGTEWTKLRNGMLSQIEACSLPLLYKLSVALPAGNQTHTKKDKTILRIDCGFLLVVISNEVLMTTNKNPQWE